MTWAHKKMSAGKKILIGLLIFSLIAAIAFQIFVTRYLPTIVKKRLEEVVLKGSDSLYKIEMGKFHLSFWGGSAQFQDLHITIDSIVYKRMSEEKSLPPLTSELTLPRVHLNGIGIWSLIFSRKINIREIMFDSAKVQLARHFRDSKNKMDNSQPLWKLIQPRIRIIEIENIYCANLKINYRNVDSAKAFHWQIEKSNILISGVKVDSASANDSSRLLFAKNISFNATDVKLKTTDGLYTMQADDVSYLSAEKIMEIKKFTFLPAVSNQQFIKHFGYQHEIYTLKVPFIRLKNFLLPQWITNNRLQVNLVELASPAISIHMDRNAKPNPYSKKGKYPHQLLQKAHFLIQVNKIKATDASVTYTETNNVTNMTGKLNFPSLSGTIDNITNDPDVIRHNPECVADIRGIILQTGKLNTVFRFKLNDKNGGFAAKATITTLNASQLQPLFTAMTAVDMQSFNMQRLDYSVNGNENAATGSLSMKYAEMDILINKVGAGKSLDKKGFLSFLANRVLIYKENPMNDEEERKATGIVVQRDVTRSFFNLVWKTMFTSAGEIVLRPMAQRKIEKRQLRAERKTERQQRREERRNQ